MAIIKKEQVKTLRFLLVGDSCVGKTTLIDTLLNKKFPNRTIDTIFFPKIYRTEIEKGFCIEMMDVKAHEDYASNRKKFYEENSKIDGILFCFSMINHNSLENLTFWTQEVEKYYSKQVPRFLMGTKIQKLNEPLPPNIIRASRHSTKEEIESTKTKINALNYYECNDTFEGIFKVFAASYKTANDIKDLKKVAKQLVLMKNRKEISLPREIIKSIVTLLPDEDGPAKELAAKFV